jgi:hypothetical protein
MLRLIFRGGYNLWQSNIVSCRASLVTNGEGPLGQEPQDLDSKRQNGCALCSTKILFVRCIIESSVTALLSTRNKLLQLQYRDHEQKWLIRAYSYVLL